MRRRQDLLALLAEIGLDDPFAGLDTAGRTTDLHGWSSRHAMFEELIVGLRPEIVVEVGTWLGASAIHMASLARSHSIETTIVCVDTWLGSAPVLWREPENRDKLSLRHGYPRQYDQFAVNVVLSGHADVIRPIPGTSRFAAAVLEPLGPQVDLLYVDGSHEYEDVLDDLRRFWPLLAPTGVAFGDDYAHNHPGVVRAVATFASETGSILRSDGVKWAMAKDPSLLR